MHFLLPFVALGYLTLQIQTELLYIGMDKIITLKPLTKKEPQWNCDLATASSNQFTAIMAKGATKAGEKSREARS